MNEESQFHNELVRPMASPATEIAAAPQPGARVVLATSPATPKTAVGSTMNSMSLLRALRRRQALALGVAIVLTGIAGPAAYFLLPAKYKAVARLHVAAQPPKVMFKTVETEALSNEDYRRYQSTQKNLVTSRLVLNTALIDRAVRSYRIIQSQIDPIAWLKDNLKVEFVESSEVMEISLSGDVPEEIAGVVNAIKKAYVDEVVNEGAKLRADRHAKLKKIKDDYVAILKEKRQKLRKLAEEAGSGDKQTLALGQQIALEHQAWLRKELMGVQSKKRQVEAARDATRRGSEETPAEASAPAVTEADIKEWIDRDPSVASLAAQLAEEQQVLNAQIPEIGRIARGGDPVLRRLRLKVAATQKQLNNKRAALRRTAIQELQARDESEQVVRGNEDGQELDVLATLEKKLKEELESVSEENQKFNVKTLDLQEYQEDVAQVQAAATQVASEVEQLTVELKAPTRMRVIEDAVAPITRDDKKRNAMIALIALGSFFGGLFGIAFLELQTQKVDSADEVPTDLGLQVVGTLPILRSKAARGGAISRKRKAKDRYWHNLLLESIDATRTMLVHAARTESHRVVMIASAVGGEGKTSLASHLATSLARSGLRTLLIDADLRSPSIHRLFDLPVGAGLSEMIRGEVDSAQAIAATEIEDLKVLTAGRCDRATIHLLSQGCLGPLFGQFKEQFDFVIVDSSPILPVADASIIAQQVDAVLFSVFRDVSRKTKVFAALQRLQSLGVRILGAVVTGAHGGLYGSDYDSDDHYSLLPEPADKSGSDPSS